VRFGARTPARSLSYPPAAGGWPLRGVEELIGFGRSPAYPLDVYRSGNGAGRSAVTANADWSLIASRIGHLTVLLLVSAAFATRAFATYQRSI
jgi:hypothetical protein